MVGQMQYCFILQQLKEQWLVSKVMQDLKNTISLDISTKHDNYINC